MSSFVNTAKSATVSNTNTSKNSATIRGITKAGQPQNYDSGTLTYDGGDPWGRDVNYDAVGTAASFTNQAKS